MRFDTLVTFEKVAFGQLDPITGNCSEQITEKADRWASVTNGATQALSLTSGSDRSPAMIAENTLTIRILGNVEESFERVRIGSKQYKVLQRRRLRRLETFVVSEVK